MTKKEDFIRENWLCTKCGQTNPTNKPNRKRKEPQRTCLKCGTKKTMRCY
jgi:hypothetical protein